MRIRGNITNTDQKPGMGFCSEDVRNMTRSDEQPIAKVVTDIAKREGRAGRYSAGNHKMLTPL